MANQRNRVFGAHDGGFVAALYMFMKDGKVATDLVAIPYDGAAPVKADIETRARADTNCETTEVPVAIKVSLVFEELDHTCPRAKHVGGGL